jgi:hypothetical protein
LTAKLFLPIVIIIYLAILFPFVNYLKDRPVAVKLGYLPEAEAIRMVAGDQRYLLAEYFAVKVLIYFGTIIEKQQNMVTVKPEYFNMFKTLETAVKLDPYNLDAYYFSQAAFTWEVGRARDVNRLLAYGMKHRTWDWTLPFYAGFNSAYFLKEYADAAAYMRKAADISGDPLLTNLTARYFYESGRNDLGILFLETMERGAKDNKVKSIYALRKKALAAVQSLTAAVNKFKEGSGRAPLDLKELVAAQLISVIPDDPYGGQFYLDKSGMVRSTSQFAFGGKTK